MSTDLNAIITSLPKIKNDIVHLREVILANAVMIGEIPAPTFEEAARMRFVCDRFTECDLQNISLDEANNAQAILPGKKGKQNILVVAHADTVALEGANTTIHVGTKVLKGSGIADNSLGLAAVISLPRVLQALNIQFDNNLILVGAAKSLGHGDLEGLRFFLDNIKRPIQAGVCVEGVHLGRLSYSCLGMVRGEISCNTKSSSSISVPTSSIVILNKILTKILAIPVSTEPKSEIILGSIRAGSTFNKIPTSARLRYEIRSEQTGKAREINEKIKEIIQEVRAESRTKIKQTTIARRKPGGIGFSHPLVKSTRAIMEALKIEPLIAPSEGDLSVLISQKIPAVTLGITTCENLHETDETINISPIFKGITQLIGVLQAIDSGQCNSKTRNKS